MNLVINAYVQMVMKMTGIGLAPVAAAYTAHDIDESFSVCSCGKDFDGVPEGYFRHLTGSVAARARVPFRDADFLVSAITNEANDLAESLQG